MAYQPIQAEKPFPPQYGDTQAQNEVISACLKISLRTVNFVQVITQQPKHTNNDMGKATGALAYGIVVAVIFGILSPITLCCSIPGIVFASMVSIYYDNPN